LLRPALKRRFITGIPDFFHACRTLQTKFFIKSFFLYTVLYDEDQIDLYPLPEGIAMVMKHPKPGISGLKKGHIKESFRPYRGVELTCGLLNYFFALP
jgi:hypothetical protein